MICFSYSNLHANSMPVYWARSTESICSLGNSNQLFKILRSLHLPPPKASLSAYRHKTSIRNVLFRFTHIRWLSYKTTNDSFVHMNIYHANHTVDARECLFHTCEWPLTRYESDSISSATSPSFRLRFLSAQLDISRRLNTYLVGYAPKRVSIPLLVLFSVRWLPCCERLRTSSLQENAG